MAAVEPALLTINNGTLSNSAFSLQVDSSGITSLKHTGDTFDTDYIREGSALGDVLLAYRVGSGEWQRTSTAELKDSCDIKQIDSGYSLTFPCGPEARPDMHLTLAYTLSEETLYWSLNFSNSTAEKIKIGDIGLSFPFNTRYTWDKQTTLTKRVLRHSFVSGHGSFMFWLRCNSVGPYLVMTPRNGTHLEYFDLYRSRGSRRRGYSAYIHSAVTGTEAIKNGGNWRQPFTSVSLSPHGTSGDSVTYGFDFSWADGYNGVRQTLYESGGLDTVVVPGMTLPQDLSAKICFRTKQEITAVDAEYPDKTGVTYRGRKGKDRHIYEVAFTRLGENKLTVRYGNNQHMYLEFFVTEPIETLIKKRSAFLVNTHQHRDTNKWYAGVFADWNMNTHTLLSPDNLDSISRRQEYMITCDDPGLGKAPLVASKNVNYPDTNEIAALEYYIEKFVWGGLQMTETEPYPYGIYGIQNWKKNRESSDPGQNGRKHVWRIYDYPHIVLLYYRMYQIATYYPEIPLHISKDEYLKRAYGTACAFFTVPRTVKGWSAYETGTYNEMIILSLLDALHAEGWKKEESILRKYWERKVQKFVSGEVNPFGSEYAFDTTGFESTHAFARYAMQHCLADTVGNTNAEFPVTCSEAKAFMQTQIAYNIFCRGWLECAYYHYGSDYRGESSRYTLTYMSQMGGWSILDYGLYYAEDPFPYLRLGYASYLSSWALMNTGTPESNYGYWYPGKQNDGGAGGGFEPAASARNWLGQSQPRGLWAHSCEIDLGFNGALRTSAAILVKDPLFGMTALGGTLLNFKTMWGIIPRDGLSRRFHVITPEHRIHLELERDGFNKRSILTIDKGLTNISFMLENRWPHDHETRMTISGLPHEPYRVTVDGTTLTTVDMKEGEEVAVMIPVKAEHISRKIEILRR